MTAASQLTRCALKFLFYIEAFRLWFLLWTKPENSIVIVFAPPKHAEEAAAILLYENSLYLQVAEV